MPERDTGGFGKRLKFFREQAGLTQSELAEAIDKSVHHITQMERGLSLPSLPIFKKLCIVLRVPADFLLMDDDALFTRYAAVCATEQLKDQDWEKLQEYVELFCRIRDTLRLKDS